MKAIVYLSRNGFFLKGRDLDDYIVNIKSVETNFALCDTDTFNIIAGGTQFTHPAVFSKTEVSAQYRVHRVGDDVNLYTKTGAVVVQSRDMLIPMISAGLVTDLEVHFVDELEYPRNTDGYSSKEFPFHDNGYRWRRVRAITHPDGRVKKGTYVREWCGEKKAPRITKKEISAKLSKIVQ